MLFVNGGSLSSDEGVLPSEGIDIPKNISVGFLFRKRWKVV